MSSGFDIIGDIHGESDKLEALLLAMGYREQTGVFQHPDRKAIFVGDIIDRGPGVRRVVEIVSRMVGDDHAYLVLGNHELNLINWFRPLGLSKTFAHPHSKANRLQLSATLDVFSEDEAKSLANWLSYQPLFLEFPKFRVAHALWDQHFISRFIDTYSSCCLSPEVLRQSDRNPWLLQGLDRLTRGLNLRLPEGYFLTGNDGVSRKRIRAKFWGEASSNYGNVLLQAQPLPPELAARELTAIQKQQLCRYGAQERPLFVGHYWQSLPTNLFSANIACVDFSAAGTGPLVAYRLYHHHTALNPEHYFHV